MRCIGTALRFGVADYRLRGEALLADPRTNFTEAEIAALTLDTYADLFPDDLTVSSQK
jgi:hypothetical protein